MICGADTEDEQRESIEFESDIILTNAPDVLRRTLDSLKTQDNEAS